MPRFLLTLLILAGLTWPAATAMVAPELPALLADGPRPVWVFFTDKGALENDPAALAATGARLSDRALARRANALGEAPTVGRRDLPNDPAYLAWLRDRGLEIRAESRWLAAVSVVADAEALDLLAAAPFVARLQPVRGAGPRELAVTPLAATARKDIGPPLDYGPSGSGLEQINVPSVHALGFDGSGVIVGMLDTGFDLTHEALAGIDVLGAWDFINDDPVVANEPGDADGQDSHGTITLSALAGFMPGQLVGPAYGASFYLAKTEDTAEETPAEEDWWVEGIEWLEAHGCDVVSSSLVYDDWYTFEDFDGNTCVTTIAADMAADLGVAVFNSAGNYRNTTGHIGAPADGDLVIAVGAVELSGEIAGFSSPGPTADGRIKPDLCALGVSVVSVVPGTADQYGTASGTSLSCPLAAGTGALLLSARPGTSPVELREALRSTASQSGSPDNDYGWGVIDALAALDALDLTAAPEISAVAAAVRIESVWPNPFNPRTTIAFTLGSSGPVDLGVYDVAGRLVQRLVARELPAGTHEVAWDGRGVRSGVYFCRLVTAAGIETRKLTLVK